MPIAEVARKYELIYLAARRMTAAATQKECTRLIAAGLGESDALRLCDVRDLK